MKLAVPKQLILNSAQTRHVDRIVQSLIRSGWSLETIPSTGTLLRNRQLMLLKTSRKTLLLRLSAFKAGESGRYRPDERRVEITTTYGHGITPLADCEDIIIGYEPGLDAFVGIDNRRLSLGGDTHNASSFVDQIGLRGASDNQILILPHPAPALGGTEYHAFFKSSRISEYLFNCDAIHQGLYVGTGLFSGPMAVAKSPQLSVDDSSQAGVVLQMSFGATSAPPRHENKVDPSLARAYEKGDSVELNKALITPSQFEAIRRYCEENGLLGERIAYESELKRLRRANRSDLAVRIDWVSRQSVSAGFDIQSFETTGAERFIEVKATSGSSFTFEMSKNEWATAERLNASYWIYRVTKVRCDAPEIVCVANPIEAERVKRLSRTPNGWLVTLTK